MRSRNFASAGTLSSLPCLAGVLRDDFRPDSDVDVLVTYEPSHRLTLSHLLSMQEEIEDLFHRSIDLVENKQLKNPYRRSNILKTHRVIYASERSG
ncbi:nucleotidyltransferase domain-containing protein [Microcoleus sp. POL10_C6]|uniref:nucleotidyltransferase domain-containing protein n=1 Tax=unclassified Microcoleus TaxID=2642155 RepID=UPI002FD41AC5